MNESIKSFSLVVITICVFIMTVIQILAMVDEHKQREAGAVPAITVNPSAIPPSPEAASKATAIDISKLPKTTIEFSESNFDFGNLKEGDVVKHSFAFKNTGANPLVISEAHGSCGCTIPSYPKEPIPPGGNGEIQVQFNSLAKSGLQNKNVTVTTNTDPAQSILNISSNVMKKE